MTTCTSSAAQLVRCLPSAGGVITESGAGAEVDVDKLKKLNHEIDLEQLQEGQTIVLPAGKLSARDKEIIAGIGRSYRTYPVREGESIQDIIEKRQISMAEVEALNPETKLNALKGVQSRQRGHGQNFSPLHSSASCRGNNLQGPHCGP